MEYRLKGWGNFAKLLNTICGDGLFNESFMFRGQGDSRWELESSYDRLKRESLVSREKGSDEILKRFSNALVYRDMGSYDTPQLAGLAQHYGLPTRYLDWSLSPYIAAFFACSGGLKCNSTSATLYILDKKIEGHISSTELEFISYFPGQNERLRNQRGCFTLLKSDTLSIDKLFTNKGLEYYLRVIKIPKSCYKEALLHLASMDVSHERLFPGISGIAEDVWMNSLIKG